MGHHDNSLKCVTNSASEHPSRGVYAVTVVRNFTGFSAGVFDFRHRIDAIDYSIDISIARKQG